VAQLIDELYPIYVLTRANSSLTTQYSNVVISTCANHTTTSNLSLPSVTSIALSVIFPTSRIHVTSCHSPYPFGLVPTWELELEFARDIVARAGLSFFAETALVGDLSGFDWCNELVSLNLTSKPSSASSWIVDDGYPESTHRVPQNPVLFSFAKAIYQQVKQHTNTATGISQPIIVVFISRAAANRRRMLNEKEVVQTLQQRIPGVIIKTISPDNVTNTIQTVAEANIIIGAHGAGLANLLFLGMKHRINNQQPLTVVEIFPPGFYRSTYKHLASMLSIRYVSVFKPLDIAVVKNCCRGRGYLLRCIRDQHFIVPPAIIADALERLLPTIAV